MSAVTLSGRVDSIFTAVSESVVQFESVKVRKPRKFRGADFTDRQVPIVAVSVGVLDKGRVVEIVRNVAADNYVAVMVDHGYRNSRSDILVYIQLKKGESKSD